MPGSSRVDLASIETVLALPQQQELQQELLAASEAEDAAAAASAGRGQYVEFTAVEEEAAPST